MQKDIKIGKELPKHIGIILDGNGRWATSRGMPRIYGHKAGINAVEDTINNCLNLNIKHISLFAFSTENWKRSKEEIENIFDILRDYLSKHTLDFEKKDIKINAFGDITVFPQDLQDALLTTINKTKNCSTMTVNLCVNYGSKQEILRAVNKLISQGKTIVTEQDFEECLYSYGQPNIDFVIRTSGEQRLSNFMLYQCAYAELYFPSIHWPDFDLKQLKLALLEYQKRDRRFGSIKENK